MRAVRVVDREREAHQPLAFRVDRGVQPGGDRPIARRRDQLDGHVRQAEPGDLRAAAVASARQDAVRPRSVSYARTAASRSRTAMTT